MSPLLNIPTHHFSTTTHPSLLFFSSAVKKRMTRTMRQFFRNSNSSPSNSSRSIGKKVEKIPCMMMLGQWDDIISLLMAAKYADALRGYCGDPSSFAASTQNATSILHFACRFHPPVDVVRLIWSYDSNSPFQVDPKTGWYPLHVAIRNGAGPQVLKWLVMKNPDAITAQDNEGRTALHIAAQYYISRYEPQLEDTTMPVGKKEATYELVNALCSEAPDMVNLEDMHGMTAIEYALDAENPLRVVKRIQKVSEKFWKKTQKEEQKAQNLLTSRSRLTARKSTVPLAPVAPEIDPQIRANIQQDKQKIQQDVLRMTENARRLAMSSTPSGEGKHNENTVQSSPTNIFRLSDRRLGMPSKGHTQSTSTKAMAA